MAARKGSTATATDSAADFSFDAVEPMAVQALPKGQRDTAPNPLLKHVADAVDQGPRAIPVPNGERAAEAAKLIRRAVAPGNATPGGLSLRLRFTDENDKALTPKTAEASTETVWVYFDVKSEKKDRAYAQRKYNNDDIRAWAAQNGIELENGKVTREVRDDYRRAHGYDVRTR